MHQFIDSKRMAFLGAITKENLQMLVKVSKFSTLYLLEEFGPMQFLFEDLMGKKYRTHIGNHIHCTCHLGNLGHCHHSLYILLRIYKVNENDPILYKDQYTQQQLKQLQAKGRALHFKQKNEGIKEKKQEREWPTFQKDTVCPVCYDQIENNSAIIDCQTCHNYFHTKCLRIWVISKKQEEQDKNNSCPMCRAQFEQQIEKRLEREEIFFVKYHQSHEINCTQCGKQIMIKLYKCLLCVKTYLCEKCYKGWEHKSHDKFIGKMSKRADWSVTSRSQFSMEKLNASVEYMKKFNKDVDIKEVIGPKYDQFMSSYIKVPSMMEHIIESMLDVEKEVHKKFKKLQFHEDEIVCCMCKKKKIVGMRKFQCNHYIDQKCLKFILKKGYRVCPIDKNYMLAGLDGVKLNLA